MLLNKDDLIIPEHAIRIHQLVTSYKPRQEPGVVLLGFACDEGVRRNHGRVGAALAPDIIRSQMANFAVHHNFHLYDAGNIACEGEDLEGAQQTLGHQVQDILKDQHFPIILGGGHEVAYGSFLGLFNAYKAHKPRIGVINFDAHFDLREGPSASSGTPFWQ
ncbi:MAG: arginase family protein, partial [Gammaproteobacteria bacterium]